MKISLHAFVYNLHVRGEIGARIVNNQTYAYVFINTNASTWGLEGLPGVGMHVNTH